MYGRSRIQGPIQPRFCGNEFAGRLTSNIHNIGNIINDRKNCKKCQKVTPYICIECNIHLHPECFIDYHNKFVYNQKLK